MFGNFASRLRAFLDTKSLATPDDFLSSIFGIVPTSSDITLTAEDALRVSPVSSAIRVISEAAASLDITIKVVENGTEAEDPGNAALPLLRDQANDWTSGYELIRDLVADALCTDAGALAYVNRIDGRAVEIIRYRPGVIAVEADQNTGQPSYKINDRPIPSENVIHLRPPLGRAPLSLAKEAIAVAAVMERHAARLFGRGARPSGVLKFDKNMGEKAVKATREAWRQAHEGDEAGGRTAVLFDGTDFKPLSFNSTDAQFLENRKFQILEVARAFRVPPSMLFELDRATWSNTEQMGREFLVYCLEPWLRGLEGALRRGLFLPDDRARFVVRFDRDDLTRADMTTRATAINSLRASKIINANEGRNWLGLEPYEGGDSFENPNINTNQNEDLDGPE